MPWCWCNQAPPPYSIVSRQLGSAVRNEAWLAMARPSCWAKDDIFSVAASGSLASSTSWSAGRPGFASGSVICHAVLLMMGCLCCMALPGCICLSAACAADQHWKRGWQRCVVQSARPRQHAQHQKYVWHMHIYARFKKQPCRSRTTLKTICYALMLVGKAALWWLMHLCF